LLYKYLAQDRELIVDEKYSVEKVYELLGKSIFLCQKIELMFKFLLSRTTVKITFDPLKNSKTKDMYSWETSKDTFGAVFNKYFKEHHSPPYDEIEVEEIENENKIGLIFSFRAPEYLESRRENIEKLISLRNELVHQFPIKFNLPEEDSIIPAMDYLTQNYEVIKKEFEAIKKDIQIFHEMSKIVFETIKMQQIIINQLMEIHQKFKDASDWTSLATAGRILNKKYIDEFSFSDEKKPMGLYKYIETLNQFELKKDDKGCKYRPILT
jgi:hypothetical protein